MDKSQARLFDDIGNEIQKAIAGEVRVDFTTRILYSTDASIYQIEPQGVVFPRTQDDLQAVLEICAAHEAPIIARGSGSGLAGQAIGAGWIIDCSRWLNRLLEINNESKTATVEPGLILNALNGKARQSGLQFGPDPASAERASLGGSIGNNAAGAHSICYGMAADHLLEADVVLGDGSLATFGEVSLDTANRKSKMGTREGALYGVALNIRETSGGVIRKRWPTTWRRASGYNLNYLFPWAPSVPSQWEWFQKDLPYPPVHEGSINLASLFAGAEGTLGVMRQMKLRLVDRPKHAVLLVLRYPGTVEACEAVPALLEYQPSAIELISHNLIQLAASVPAYANLVGVLRPLFENGKAPPAILVVEFNGENQAELQANALKVAGCLPHIFAADAVLQNKIWGVRKAGLGLFMSRVGDAKPWSFIEDLSVPVEHLGEFVREMYRIMHAYGVEGENYGHASAGCLHIRPVLNLKTLKGVEVLRAIATEAVELTLSLGGAVSGEHGDGLVRSEWGERMFGSEIMQAFHLLKLAADPSNLLNPGKIISLNDSPPPKIDQDLRFGPDYRSKGWEPFLDFSRQAGLERAIEQCNGAGVCRKQEGVMCPSFQATRDEIFSTRGRANLLRAMISGKYSNTTAAEKAVKETLDLCLACKGCKSECPSGVDMAKLKYEFLEHFYKTHTRQARDYLFGYVDLVGKLSQPLWFIANPILRSEVFAALAENWLGISRERRLPTLARQRMSVSWRRLATNRPDIINAHSHNGKHVLFLLDPFTEFFYPQSGLAALQVLEMIGCRVEIIPVIGAGRTLISKGFVLAAKKKAQQMFEEIERLDPDQKCAIVGVEPSEVASLYDEYLDLLGHEDERIYDFARRAYNVEEFLLRIISEGCLNNDKLRIAINPQPVINNSTSQNKKQTRQILLHGHCYQKARLPSEDELPLGVEASQKLLEMVGYSVNLIDSGCCGVAGAFGYEKEHKAIADQVGELALLPAVRAASLDTLIAASGVSCRTQIQDGTGRIAYHPIELFKKALENESKSPTIL